MGGEKIQRQAKSPRKSSAHTTSSDVATTRRSQRATKQKVKQTANDSVDTFEASRRTGALRPSCIRASRAERRIVPSKSLLEQRPDIRDKLLGASKQPFLDQVPLVVAYTADEKLLIGRSDIYDRHRAVCFLTESWSEDRTKAWESAFSHHQFLFFLDEHNPPLQLKHFDTLKEAGVSSNDLTADLLMPEYMPEISLILLAYMCKRGSFGEDARPFEDAFHSKIDARRKSKGETMLLFASLFSTTTELSQYLLSKGVSPNSFDEEDGFCALDYCNMAKSFPHRQLLIEAGADTSLEFKTIG